MIYLLKDIGRMQILWVHECNSPKEDRHPELDHIL